MHLDGLVVQRALVIESGGSRIVVWSLTTLRVGLSKLKKILFIVDR